MLLNAKGGVINIEDTFMEYISFGNADKTLIMIPGLGDGLKTVKKYAVPFAMMYREYAKEYTVYVFSRRNNLPKAFSTRAMANDIVFAMEYLNIEKADVLGVSQGGMIAQHLAVDYPDKVNKLCLAVTLSKPNETSQKVVSSWIEMANAGDYKNLFIDTAEKSYSEKYLKKNRWLYPLMSKIGKPKEFNRFIIMANACLTHNSYDELEKIKAPTLIIGGADDKIVTAKASKEIAEKISNSQIHIYKGLGHSAYEEARDFNLRVLEFLITDYNKD